MYRQANGVVSRFALEGLAYGSTAGGREFESRRPDWQKARQMAGFSASGDFPSHLLWNQL